MLTLLFGALFALPFLAIGAILWLVTLPIRLLFGIVFGGIFRLIFGLGGALLGLIIAPIVMVVVGVALIGAFVVAPLALVAPLIPVILLALLAWAIYRASGARPQASGLS
jgi:hypothetical protein